MTATNAAQLAELFRNIAAAFDAYNDAGGTEQTPMPPMGAPVPPSCSESMQQTAPAPEPQTQPAPAMPEPQPAPVPESAQPAPTAPTVEEVQQHVGMLARKLPPEKVENIKRMIQGYGVGFISKLSPEQLADFMTRVKAEFSQ